MKLKIWKILGAVCLLAALICMIFINVKKKGMYDENGAKRWSEDEAFAQIRVIYPLTGMELNEYSFLELDHNISSRLESTAYGVTDFPRSLSANGSLTLSSDKGSIEADCVGVEEDYFLMHPMPLLKGSYLTGDDMMDDGIIIDESIAWKLFGSNDVCGLTVNVGEVPLIIRGVMDKPDDTLSMEAGLTEDFCFVSMNSLRSYGRVEGSYVYEVILPDPVSGFAYDQVTQAIGEDTLKQVEVIDCSERFSTDALNGVWMQTGLRSMRVKGMVYPYFENIAKATEDYLAILMLFTVVLLCPPVVIFIICFIGFLKGDKYKKVKEYERELWKNLKEYVRLHSPL